MGVIDRFSSEGMASSSAPFYVAGLGASAGGLEALNSFFEALPGDSGIAFVVIQHLAPTYRSQMVELLSNHTRMPVSEAEDGMRLEPNHIYVIPPGKSLTLLHGALLVSDVDEGAPHYLIDTFFQSLAADCAGKAIAISLSGTGTDGTNGIRAIKEAGGMAMVQDEESAKFKGMPASANATGLADYVLAASEMPAELLRYIHHPFMAPEGGARIHPDETGVKKIVALLRSRTGIDFSEYKQSTVLRRIERRIGIVNVGSIDEYLQYMQQFEQEVFKLEKDLLISVTRFFRDPEAFAALREDVIPAILEKASCGEAIRIWIPACASGEEAYTIAMLFNEAKDTLGKTIDLKIFATDVDKAALSHASAGVYPKNIEEEVPPELLARYFVAQGDVYHICERVRKMVIFARQDILRDPPFVKVDLISCRNLLIYLQFPFQQKVLSLLHFALRPGAFLMLGISETVGEKQELFETVNKKARIFKKREDSVASIAGVVSRTPGEAGHLESPPGPTPERRAHTERAQQEKLLSTVSEKLIADYAPTCFVLNEKHEILQSFGQTRRYIELPPGRFTRDILSLLPPPLALALSGIFRRMQDEQRIISYRGVRFDRDGVAATVDLRVEPMPAMRGQPPSILVFVEEPKPSPPDGEVHQFDVSCHSAERIADLEYDLRDTREQLQQAIEEKETANEELQAANEELLASNEELQSTNEELESVNEELSTLNAEFQEKISELTQANDDLENVLSASNIAFIFLDGDLRIRRFTTAVTREINLVQHDAGRRLTDIRSPLIDAIAEDLPRVASSSECVTKTVEPAPGSRCLLTITPFRRMGASNQGLVITILNTADGTPS